MFNINFLLLPDFTSPSQSHFHCQYHTSDPTPSSTPEKSDIFEEFESTIDSSHDIEWLPDFGDQN